MTDKKTELRKQAEEKAYHLSEDLDTLSPAETRQALYELRVHQIELEIQNEELRQSQAELDAARARYFDLYDLAPVGYCTLSKPGLIREANLTAATMLGVARGKLVKRPLLHYILPEDRDIYYLHLRQLWDIDSASFLRLHSGQAGQAGVVQTCELRMLKKDGTTFWAYLEAAVQDPAAGEAQAGTPELRIVLSDITRRKQAEEALEKERRRLQQALDEIRTLRGIVPICSYCKKIRDDEGYWNQVEQYVSKHTDAQFSHGICPACFEREMKGIKGEAQAK